MKTIINTFLISVCAFGGATFAANPERYFESEILLWDLSPGSNLVTTVNDGTGASELEVDDANPDAAILPRLTIGWTQDRDSIELSYWGLGDWNDSHTVTGNNDLSLDGAVALATLDFFDADRMTIRNDAEIHNVEANLWQAHGPMELLFGFRYIRFDETFNINSMDLDSGTSDYRIDTVNDVFAVQTGARAETSFHSWTLRGVSKLGFGISDQRQDTFLGDFNNTAVLRDSRTKDAEFSLIAELGVKAERRINSLFSFTMGYDLLWIDNIARAADQLDFTDVATSGTELHTHGRGFLHGGSCGLVANW
ncbi:BBP7 family outer membrane beta-barrel protein [Neorhodopirellula lusitana]|nr:BBP7 family outer membrane beta-barrel protein [Neorhodopirellula lusitana]